MVANIGLLLGPSVTNLSIDCHGDEDVMSQVLKEVAMKSPKLDTFDLGEPSDYADWERWEVDCSPLRALRILQLQDVDWYTWEMLPACHLLEEVVLRPPRVRSGLETNFSLIVTDWAVTFPSLRNFVLLV